MIPGHRRTAGDIAQSMPPEMPHMVGDFDDNANALWSLHVKEAKSHDEARIQTLKGDMDGVLIFVRVYISTITSRPELMHSRQAGLFSAALTSFITDKIHDLQVDPAQQMVYYQQQNVALLAQISNQVFSIAPQVSVRVSAGLRSPDTYGRLSHSHQRQRQRHHHFSTIQLTLRYL